MPVAEVHQKPVLPDSVSRNRTPLRQDIWVVPFSDCAKDFMNQWAELQYVCDRYGTHTTIGNLRQIVSVRLLSFTAHLSEKDWKPDYSDDRPTQAQRQLVRQLNDIATQTNAVLTQLRRTLGILPSADADLQPPAGQSKIQSATTQLRLLWEQVWSIKDSITQLTERTDPVGY